MIEALGLQGNRHTKATLDRPYSESGCLLKRAHVQDSEIASEAAEESTNAYEMQVECM